MVCPDAERRLVFALSRYGGLRCPSEHLILTWNETDWAKNHRERTQAEGHNVETGVVFCALGGSYLYVSNVRLKSFRPIVQRAKLPCGLVLSDLRDTACTLLCADGVDPKTASVRLGHSDIKTTLTHYAHVVARMQEKAVQSFGRLYAATFSSPSGGPRPGLAEASGVSGRSFVARFCGPVAQRQSRGLIIPWL